MELEDLPNSSDPDRDPLPMVETSVAAVDPEAGESAMGGQSVAPKRASLINTAPGKKQ